MTAGDDTNRPVATLIGHSHSEAIFAAARTLGLALGGFNFWTAPQPAIAPDRSALHPEIAAGLAHGPVFSAVGGTVHAMMGMVQHPRPFDFVLPSYLDLPLVSEAERIPFATMRAAVAAGLAEFHEIIALVRAAASGPVWHFEAPPPAADSARVFADVPWMFFGDFARAVSAPALRWKLWRLANDLTRAFCEANGVTFVPCPDAAFDADGYLAPDLYRDSMHVNERYGALIVAQIEGLLRSDRA